MTAQRLPRPRRTPSRLRSVHPHQLTLSLTWSADDLAARRHLALLPTAVREPEPMAPAASIRRAA